MFSGSLGPISRRATYIETLALVSDDDGLPLDLTGAAITVSIAPIQAGFPYPRGVTADLTSGVTVPAPGIIQWRFEQSAAQNFSCGLNRVSVVISRDGDTDEVLNATLPVED